MDNFDPWSQVLAQVAENRENYKHDTLNPEVLQLQLMFKGLVSQVPLHCFHSTSVCFKKLLFVNTSFRLCITSWKLEANATTSTNLGLGSFSKQYCSTGNFSMAIFMPRHHTLKLAPGLGNTSLKESCCLGPLPFCRNTEESTTFTVQLGLVLTYLPFTTDLEVVPRLFSFVCIPYQYVLWFRNILLRVFHYMLTFNPFKHLIRGSAPQVHLHVTPWPSYILGNVHFIVILVSMYCAFGQSRGK